MDITGKYSTSALYRVGLSPCGAGCGDSARCHKAYSDVHWQNDAQGEHDFNGDDGKPQASRKGGDMDLLETLSRKTYVQNYNIYSRAEGRGVKLVESAEGAIHRYEPEEDVNKFLERLGLQECLVKFNDQEIDMEVLKAMKFKNFKAPGIPL
ncbi:hypothetical protein IFM89_037465 [Coptis chinensis]|uniref:Uncharacterized protein n=1 Tax=Coptis chinensis TaxID=261450 RepID=A0A835HSZ9_9MAGN|nr:hypothetical protein IFM89_037465 [Coptis chinensis]